MYRAAVRFVNAFALCALFAVRISAQAQYAITDLGTLGGPTAIPHGINAAGQVVGEADTSAGVRHAFLWQNGTMTDLNAPGEPSQALGINTSGQVVGTAGPPPQGGPAVGFLWTSAGGIQTLSPLTNAPYTIGAAINTMGQIAGTSALPGPFTHAVFWSSSAALPLDINGAGLSSQGYGINDSGQVVGYSENWGQPGKAFLWTSAGGLQDLGTLPWGNYSAALGINDLGQVVGNAGIQGGILHAFLWTSAGGMQDLQTLGGDSSTADAVNSSQQVVGWANTATGAMDAFRWQNGNIVDLNTLISDPSWTLVEATAINDSGQIAGYGTHNGQTRAFILTPIATALCSPPQSLFADNSGAAGLSQATLSNQRTNAGLLDADVLVQNQLRFWLSVSAAGDSPTNPLLLANQAAGPAGAAGTLYLVPPCSTGISLKPPFLQCSSPGTAAWTVQYCSAGTETMTLSLTTTSVAATLAGFLTQRLPGVSQVTTVVDVSKQLYANVPLFKTAVDCAARGPSASNAACIWTAFAKLAFNQNQRAAALGILAAEDITVGIPGLIEALLGVPLDAEEMFGDWIIYNIQTQSVGHAGTEVIKLEGQ
jgi:probable HAF family extracellular repeat protein